jgi:GT2 family glycosyltransferase
MAAPDENNITENPDRLKLVDILVFGILPNNMTFSRTIWESTNRFDSTLQDDLVLWDFAIKALKADTRYAMLCSAALNAGDVDPNMLQPALTEEKYLEIIERHRGLYDTNLDHILKLVADNQQVPQNVINNLSLKISSITGLLNHSKDELRSLNDYSASLQSRIRTLESSRLYRWSERIHHYKKIFFKEKKPGTSRLKSILKFILFIFSRAGFGLLRIFIARILLKFYSVFEKRPYKIIYSEITKPSSNTSTSEQHFLTYHDWMVANSDYSKLKKEFDEFIVSAKIRPKISIIMPVYDPAVDFLKEAIESVKNQLYSNWELCIADDCSPNPQIRRLLNAYSLKDPRIKINFRTENGHISAASNSALELVTGDYVMLMDHDDVITQNAVSEFVRHINNHPEDQLIYSDEDKIQNGTYFDPFFKPDYSPDKLISTNYISHLTVIRKDLMDKVKGFTLGLEGSQDFDLMLRCTEFTNRVGHIPKVLYHWRVHELSVASGSEAKPYAYIAAKKAIEAALVRRNTPGEVQYQLGRGYYRTKYKIKAFEKVSIIIPTKDAARLTKNTIDSILALTDYPNYEIIVLDNNSNTQEFFDLMAGYKASHPDKFRCIEAKFPFNFSKLINLGVASSDGEFVLMLNNDVEIIQNDWLTYMVSYSQHSRVGAVGVKLLFPDDKIQHAGVVIGLGDIRIAGHLFVNYYKDDHGYFNYIQTTSNYSAVTGACLMCRRSVYEEVGGMDENLEVEYNDIDFCLKIQEKGYNNVYLADVTLYHYESATREHPRENKVAYTRHLKEVEYFRSRWSKYIEHDPYFNPNLSLDYGDCRYELR